MKDLLSLFQTNRGDRLPGSVVKKNNTSKTPSFLPAVSVHSDESKDGGKSNPIIGKSDEIKKVFDLINKVAAYNSTVMIYGESGTGKELFARAIHNKSSRRNKPFIPINCGAIPENLLESELFGHVKGSFTGATSNKRGKFEQANGGTLFLDEIGDMSTDLQVKILRVLEEREVEPVGGSKSIKVDARIVAATHRNLEEAVEKGTFRKDLFYRLEVIPITLPPLRKRKLDIPLLVNYFMEQFSRGNKQDGGISDEAMAMMISYSWPGNIRELKNMVERFVVLNGGQEILPGDLPQKLKRQYGNDSMPQVDVLPEGICLNSAVSEFEKTLIIQSLEQSKWVKKKAAKLLRVNRTTLVEKIKRHHLHQHAA